QNQQMGDPKPGGRTAASSLVILGGPRHGRFEDPAPVVDDPPPEAPASLCAPQGEQPRAFEFDAEIANRRGGMNSGRNVAKTCRRWGISRKTPTTVVGKILYLRQNYGPVPIWRTPRNRGGCP